MIRVICFVSLAVCNFAQAMLICQEKNLGAYMCSAATSASRADETAL